MLIGSPIWNVRPPMILSTLIEKTDLAGKRVLAFLTHAVSGPGPTVEDYTELLPDTTIGDGLAVRGEQVTTATGDVEEWLSAAGLLA